MSPKRDRKPHGVAYWCGWAVVSTMLYVSSIGPAAYAFRKLGEPTWAEWILTIYFPLALVSQVSPSAEESLESYIERWYDWAEPSP